MLELQLPNSSMRLDCLVTGKDQSRQDSAVIVELKQWEQSQESAGENEVVTWVAGRLRDQLHPSAQVGHYKLYLEDNHTAFSEDNPVTLHACSYLHNYEFVPGDALRSEKFSAWLATYPAFSKDDVDSLVDFLQPKLNRGDGAKILGRIDKGSYRPSKKLLNHVANLIQGKQQYILLDEQLVVFDRVMQMVRTAQKRKGKSTVLIKGGPGTGKSLIAMNLIGRLSKEGFNAHYVTGSRAFTETLRKIIGARGSSQFKYFNSYADSPLNSVDVLICDEAHRIRTTSNNRYTPKARQSKCAQIQELLNPSRTSVFFIDDWQIVRPGEIGSSAYIKQEAEAAGHSVFEYELEAQFRCAGADGFINWVDNTLGVRRTANVLWNLNEDFEFRIFDSPRQLDVAIRAKIAEGTTARLSAGFCWPWSDPSSDGALVEDVVIDGFRRPWNAKPNAGRLAKGIPKASLWAHDPKGVEQIGCVYTAQGFEFDFIGVIFGDDLFFDAATGEWKGNPRASFDTVLKRSNGDFVRHVQNTYRVLMTRGMKGCYVSFLNRDTENFFRSRIERAGGFSA
jgi:hypothetical protein